MWSRGLPDLSQPWLVVGRTRKQPLMGRRQYVQIGGLGRRLQEAHRKTPAAQAIQTDIVNTPIFEDWQYAPMPPVGPTRDSGDLAFTKTGMPPTAAFATVLSPSRKSDCNKAVRGPKRLHRRRKSAYVSLKASPIALSPGSSKSGGGLRAHENQSCSASNEATGGARIVHRQVYIQHTSFDSSFGRRARVKCLTTHGGQGAERHLRLRGQLPGIGMRSLTVTTAHRSERRRARHCIGILCAFSSRIDRWDGHRP